MKVKMNEWFQGKGQPTLKPGEEYEVSELLGAWLLEHGKAVEVEKPKPEKKPEPPEEVAQPDPIEKKEIPVMSTKKAEKPTRARKGRGSKKS